MVRKGLGTRTVRAYKLRAGVDGGNLQEVRRKDV